MGRLVDLPYIICSFAGAASAVAALAVGRCSAASILCAGLAVMLALIAMHDLATRRIENGAVLAIVGLRTFGLALEGILRPEGCALAALDSLFAGAAMLALLLATAWLNQRLTGAVGIGGGDIKLLAALAFFLGLRVGCAVAGLSCALMLAVQALRRSRAPQAFAPYIAVSTIAALLVT